MKRVVPGLLIAALWLILVLLGPIWLFCLVVVAAVLLAADEYTRMVDGRSPPLPERWAINLLLALPVVVVALFPRPVFLLPALLAAFFALTAYLLYRYRDLADPYGLFVRLVFGLVYIGLLGAHVVLLRFLPEGGPWLIIASAITAASDSGAYFVGRALGRRKLCANISPNKTVEGAAGGVVAGVVATLLFGWLLLPAVSWHFLVPAAIVLALVGIAGDLTESIIKRGTGSKDSGRCLAGHGGILDRADSLLFVTPSLYLLLVLPGWL